MIDLVFMILIDGNARGVNTEAVTAGWRVIRRWLLHPFNRELDAASNYSLTRQQGYIYT